MKLTLLFSFPGFIETPSFVKPMEDKDTVTGETTVLECMASGSPKPRLTWTKDGGPLVATERHFFTADNQLLIIVHTKASDAGRYECDMSNSLGTERDSSMVSVIPASLASGSLLDDESATIGIIIIAVVCCVVGTSIVWVIIIYQTRKRARTSTTTSTTGSHPSAPATNGGGPPFPGVEFMATETDDPDIDVDIEGMRPTTTILYPPDMEILAYKERGSNQQLYTYIADNNSDSEQSSSKDSGTGDSARRSNEELAAPLNRSMNSLNTPAISEASGEAPSVIGSSLVPCLRMHHPRRSYHNYNTRTLSTFVPIQARPIPQFAEVDHLSAPPNDPGRVRMSLYEDNRATSPRGSVGSPVTNFSMARHEV